MTSFDQLLTWLLLYGYPVLFGVVLAAAVGAPLPANLMLLAAGGFVAQGELELAPAAGVVLGAAILGDCVVYAIAAWGGESLAHRHGARIGLGPRRLEAARGRIGRWMSLSVFMTRWLLTPLAAPTAAVAGLSRHPIGAYAISITAGEALWTSIYVGLGYVFGESWPAVMAWVGDSAGLVTGLGLTATAVALLIWLARAERCRETPA